MLDTCEWRYTGSCTFLTACGELYVYEDPPTICPKCGRAVAGRWVGAR